MDADGRVAKCHAMLLTLGLLLCLEVAAVRAVEFHVALTGDDASAGTEKAPFRTLTRARDAIRAWRAAGEMDAGEVVVKGREGKERE